MPHHIRFLISGLLLFSLSSCFKEDKPVKLPKDSEARVTSVFLGKSYESQLFYNLSEGVVAQRDIEDWEFAFDMFSNEFKVLTNSGRDIFVARTAVFSVAELKQLSLSALSWNYDFPNGNLDSNAIGNWTERYPSDSSAYFILDMGRMLPLSERYFYFRLLRKSNSQLQIQYGLWNSNQAITTLIVNRDSNRNFAYVSFRKGIVYQEFEPLSQDWDLLFTRYRHIFYIDPNPTDPFPYLVTGAILNPRFTSVSIDTVLGFQTIDLQKAQSLSYSSRPDIIGYAWKNFDFTVSFTYSVNPNTTYIVRSEKSGSPQYYKLRFLDFYNENREKGYPKFEIKPILF